MPAALLNASLFAVEALAASLMLPLSAWLCCLLLRERAALRHLVWLSVFAALLLLPLLVLLVPSQFVLQQMPDPGYATQAADAVAVPVPVPAAPPMIAALATIWLTGLCWHLLRLATGLYGLRRLRRLSVRFRLDAPVRCEVRLAPTAPLTFGWLNPVILLPLAAPSWPRDRLDAVLAHEAAHVRRRDHLSNALSLLACALYWPSPLVWWARRELGRAAEICADNCVIASGMKPSLYAAHLLAVAREHHGRVSFAALAMATPSWLEARVLALLSPTEARKDAAAPELAGFVGLGLVTALILALLRPGIIEAPLSAARTPNAASQVAGAGPSGGLGRERGVATSRPRVISGKAGPVHAGNARPAAAQQPAYAGRPGHSVSGEALAPGDLADDSAGRAVRLALQRIAREDRLRLEAEQQRIAREERLARARIDRELALETMAVERAARLAREKVIRDAAHGAL